MLFQRALHKGALFMAPIDILISIQLFMERQNTWDIPKIKIICHEAQPKVRGMVFG